jgi:hypothetical protein
MRNETKYVKGAQVDLDTYRARMLYVWDFRTYALANAYFNYFKWYQDEFKNDWLDMVCHRFIKNLLDSAIMLDYMRWNHSHGGDFHYWKMEGEK